VLQRPDQTAAGILFALCAAVFLYYCLFMFDQAIFKRYEELIRKTDLFCADLVQKFDNRLQCRPGCALCCSRDIDVLPVEFYFLRSCAAVSDAVKLPGNSSRQQDACSFLRRNHCAVYACRPIICRTHGLPLLIRSEEGEQRDCCPLNAETLGLDTLACTDLIDLETLNTLLSAVNLLFCKQAGIDPAQKLPLSHLLEKA